MRVILRRDWFAPGDLLYLARNNPNEVDDTLLPYLPSTARIAGENPRDTRKKVLSERRKLKLDRPAPDVGSNVDFTDDELKAELMADDLVGDVNTKEEIEKKAEKLNPDNKHRAAEAMENIKASGAVSGTPKSSLEAQVANKT